jgi:hypothetical protein
MTQQWSDGVHQGIAEAIQAARGERSAQWLADETERLGHRVSRDSITNIENGRKSTLDICELLILAAALDVPAVGLLFPNLPDGQVELSPGKWMPADDALFRFTGEHGPQGVLSQTDLARLLRLTRDRFAKRLQWATMNTGIDKMIAAAKRTPRQKQIFAAEQIMLAANITEQIDELNGQMAEIPGAVVVKREGQE